MPLEWSTGYDKTPSHLESSWAPVHKLDGPLRFDSCYGSIDILGHHITSVQHAASHVLAMSGITLDQLVGWFKAGVGDLSHRQLLMVGLLSTDDWGIGGQWEVDTWVGNQVGLELCQIHIQSTIKAQWSGDGGDYLTNQTVQVGVGWTFNVQVTPGVK